MRKIIGLGVLFFALMLGGIANAGPSPPSPVKQNASSYSSSGTTANCLNGGCSSSPAQYDGTWTYCVDCAPTNNICAAGGTGAIAYHLSGVWNCSTPVVTGNVPNPLYANTIIATGASPSISGFNIDGELNVLSFGASGSSNTCVGTTSAGGSSVTSVGSCTLNTNDFAAGQGILISQAGAACTLAGAACSGITPATPTVGYSGTSGTTPYCVKLAYTENDANGVGGETAAGSAACANGEATITPNSGDVLSVTIPADSHTGVYDRIIYLSINGGAYNFYGRTNGTASYVWRYIGQSAREGNVFGLVSSCGDDVACTAPASARNNHYIGTVQTSSTNALTVSPVTPSAVSAVPLLHNDSAAFATAQGAAVASGKPVVHVPSHLVDGSLAVYRIVADAPSSVGGINDTGLADHCVSWFGDTGRSNITGDTGKYAVFERIGSNGCQFTNLAITCGNEDIEPCRIGILGGADNASVISGAANGIFGTDEHVSAVVWDDPGDHCTSANTNCYGTFADVNAADDVHDWHDIIFEASTAMLWLSRGADSADNTGFNYYGVTSAYDTISTVFYGGNYSPIFSGPNTFISGGGPGILTQGEIHNISMPGTVFFSRSSPFWSNAGIGVASTAHPFNIEIGNAYCYGQLINSDLEGESESTPNALELGGGAGTGACGTTQAKIVQNVLKLNSPAIGLGSGSFYYDTKSGGVGLNHYWSNNTIYITGPAGGPHSGFTIQSGGPGTYVTGNSVGLMFDETWDMSNAAECGGNVFRLGDSYSTSNVIECASADGALGDMVVGQGSVQNQTAFTSIFNYCGTNGLIGGTADLILSGGAGTFQSQCLVPGMSCQVTTDVSQPSNLSKCYAGTPYATTTATGSPVATATVGAVPIACSTATPASAATDTVRIRCF